MKTNAASQEIDRGGHPLALIYIWRAMQGDDIPSLNRIESLCSLVRTSDALRLFLFSGLGQAAGPSPPDSQLSGHLSDSGAPSGALQRVSPGPPHAVGARNSHASQGTRRLKRGGLETGVGSPRLGESRVTGVRMKEGDSDSCRTM
jgi:hypothetical protein